MKEIMFKRVSKFLGRNGEFKSIGLSMTNISGDEVRINPINSRNDLARCAIRVPVESVPELIEALKTFC